MSEDPPQQQQFMDVRDAEKTIINWNLSNSNNHVVIIHTGLCVLLMVNQS